ncbi:sterol desaturase family protein [Ruegeria atlantica]|uniref:sterol desaturase family protein n=1 Tax=Ruegeria atlantica TaxID=81569 RepID=UPI00147CD68C|nr:sterol desaturase family protein [Ruegeria atlantica]
MDLIREISASFGSLFWSWGSRFAILHLCVCVFIVYAIWHFRGRPTGFLRFIFPREIYFHRSNLVDIQVFLVNFVLGAFGFFGAVLFAPVVVDILLTKLISLQGAAFQPLDVTWGRSALATLIIVMTADFCKYWTHYLHHESRVLWPFHSLHHSAEVLTPLTVSRIHPVYILIRNLMMSLGVGVAQALMLFLLIGKIDLLTIGGANAGYFLFNLFGANLRHSHVWLSFGPVLEHIFISPAQHQIHHSCAVKHHNKNYGEVFALWDWIFGTLYIPKTEEKLEFGIADAQGVKIEQPHATLKDAFVRPFLDSFEEVSGMPRIQRSTDKDQKPSASQKQ